MTHRQCPSDPGHWLKETISGPYAAKGIASLTLLTRAESFGEIRGLTVDTLRISQHLEKKACFTEQAIFPRAGRPDMAFCQLSYRSDEAQSLHQSIRVGIHNVSFESAVRCLVIETASGRVKLLK